MLPPLLLNLGCFALLEWFKTEKVQITVTKNAWSTISTNYSMMFGILSESHIFPIILRIRITLENSNKFNMVTLAFSIKGFSTSCSVPPQSISWIPQPVLCISTNKSNLVYCSVSTSWPPATNWEWGGLRCWGFL